MTRETCCFVSRQIDGKGIGVIAIRDISEGDLIISEEPLLVIPWWVRATVDPRKPKITELGEILCQFLDELPEEKRQLFMSLSDCKVDENEEEKTELGIWRTNNFALGRTTSKSSNGIFPTIARFNHSCIPSAEFGWNEKAGRQEIRAIRNIKAQEEISLCYFTSQWQLENVDVRRQYLQESYGFFCTCQACILTDSDLKVDVEKRTRVQQLKKQFDELVYEYVTDTEEESNENNLDKKNVISVENLCLELHEALSLGLERLRLMDELRIKVRSRLDFVQELYEVACDCDANKLKHLISQRGLELAQTLFGPNDENTKVWRGKVSHCQSLLALHSD